MKALPFLLPCAAVVTIDVASFAQSVNPFADAEAKRWAARQRSNDRGLRTESASREKIDKMGSLPPLSIKERITQGLAKPPDGKAYARVMEAARLLGDSRLINNNDRWIDWLNGGESFTEAKTEALRLYPDLANPNALFRLRFDELCSWAGLHDAPLLKNTRCPLLIAHIVAIELTGSFSADSLGAVTIQAPRPALPEPEPPPTVAILESPVAPGAISKPPPIPERLEIKIRNGHAYFEDGLPTRVRTDLMGRMQINFPMSPGSTDRYFKLPSDRDSGFVTMPNGQTRRFRKRTFGDDIKITIEP